jgi:hypothetical protein
MDAADFVLRDFSPASVKELPFVVGDAVDARSACWRRLGACTECYQRSAAIPQRSVTDDTKLM